MPPPGSIEIGSVLAGGKPFAFVTGEPLRIVVASSLWRSALTDKALALAPTCGAGRVVVAPPFTLFGAAAAGTKGQADGVLVVAATGLGREDRHDLLVLARMFARSKVSRLANLLRRLQEADPHARSDLFEELVFNKYNLTRVAGNIGTTRPTLYRYIRQLDIPIRRVPAALRDDDEGGDLGNR